MLLVAACVAILEIISLISNIETKRIDPRSVNVALETVLAFNNRDNAKNIKFIDEFQNFLAKVKQTVVDNGRRNLNNDNIAERRSFGNVNDLKFTDFIKKLILILKDYQNEDLEDVFAVVDDEIRKYHYKGCKFYELVSNQNIRRYVSETLDFIKEQPGDILKKKLDATLQAIEDAKYDSKQTNLLDYINSLYTKRDIATFQKVLDHFDMYKFRSKRANINIIKVVRDSIRNIIFDHYSYLSKIIRQDFKKHLEEFMSNHAYKPDDLQLPEYSIEQKETMKDMVQILRKITTKVITFKEADLSPLSKSIDLSNQSRNNELSSSVINFDFNLDNHFRIKDEDMAAKKYQAKLIDREGPNTIEREVETQVKKNEADSNNEDEKVTALKGPHKEKLKKIISMNTEPAKKHKPKMRKRSTKRDKIETRLLSDGLNPNVVHVTKMANDLKLPESEEEERSSNIFGSLQNVIMKISNKIIQPRIEKESSNKLSRIKERDKKHVVVVKTDDDTSMKSDKNSGRVKKMEKEVQRDKKKYKNDKKKNKSGKPTISNEIKIAGTSNELIKTKNGVIKKNVKKLKKLKRITANKSKQNEILRTGKATSTNTLGKQGNGLESVSKQRKSTIGFMEILTTHKFDRIDTRHEKIKDIKQHTPLTITRSEESTEFFENWEAISKNTRKPTYTRQRYKDMEITIKAYMADMSRKHEISTSRNIQRKVSNKIVPTKQYLKNKPLRRINERDNLTETTNVITFIPLEEFQKLNKEIEAIEPQNDFMEEKYQLKTDLSHYFWGATPEYKEKQKDIKYIAEEDAVNKETNISEKTKINKQVTTPKNINTVKVAVTEFTHNIPIKEKILRKQTTKSIVNDTTNTDYRKIPHRIDIDTFESSQNRSNMTNNPTVIPIEFDSLNFDQNTPSADKYTDANSNTNFTKLEFGPEVYYIKNFTNNVNFVNNITDYDAQYIFASNEKHENNVNKLKRSTINAQDRIESYDRKIVEAYKDVRAMSEPLLESINVIGGEPLDFAEDENSMMMKNMMNYTFAE